VIAEALPETLLEKIMRFSPAAVALSLSFAMLSSAGMGKKADDDINAVSLALMKKGEQAAQANKQEEAVDYFETALAVDPRNRAAYIGVARAVRAKGLNGKAIRFYKEALELDPNDQTALSEQGNAMLAKGAIEQAKSNLARLKMLCKADCAAGDQLALAIDKIGDKQKLQASAVAIDPIVGDAPAKTN
jgi:tetratricopeptide (TPR) repeat protein